MICLPDSDIFLKLLACDLWGATLQELGVTEKETYFFQFEARGILRDRSKEQQYGRQVFNRATPILMKTNSTDALLMNDAQDQAEALILNAIDAIDVGEAILFRATRSLTEFHLITADRKCLKALYEAKEECADIYTRMCGKVLTLEQILLLLLPTQDYTTMQSKIRPHATSDGIFSIFASAKTSEEAEQFLLKSIVGLRAKTGSLLAP